MIKISRNSMIIRRMEKLRRTVEVDTLRMRGKSLKALEELFNMAKSLAQNKELDLNVRQKWTQVAAYICQVINSVATGFDEKQIDVQLDKLEALVNEAATKAKTKRPGRETSRAKAEDDSAGPS